MRFIDMKKQYQIHYRTCKECRVAKSPEEFYINGKRKQTYTKCKECVLKAQKSREENNWAHFLWASAKKRLKGKDLELFIDPSDVIIPANCPLLNIPLVKNIGCSAFNSATLDRIDNTKGYIKGNVWVISRLANTMKNSATLEEWKIFCTNSLKALNNFVQLRKQDEVYAYQNIYTGQEEILESI